DLAQGPLFRPNLVRVKPDEHILLVTMHHIVSDGWSISVFLRELSALYQSFSENQPSPLPELPIQYADFASWQLQHLSGAVLANQLAYWKAQLAGAPSALELPTDHPRPVTQSFRGGRQPVALSKALSEELKALAQQQGVTLFAVTLAAFQILLSRYSRKE